jgi:hypothetical protein
MQFLDIMFCGKRLKTLRKEVKTKVKKVQNLLINILMQTMANKKESR